MELLLVLGIPLLGAAVLALIGARRYAAEVNALMSLGTLVAAGHARPPGHPPRADAGLARAVLHRPFNVFLVALTAFVGFTTALFSRPYMRIEEHKGRMTPARLRLYHSMYQLFMSAMLLALLTNNMGLLWVAMEVATLSTVLLVSLYRTRASLEAAWKYFILCGVGIAQALFGTMLLYFAAEGLLGGGGDGGPALDKPGRDQGPARADGHRLWPSCSSWWDTAPRSVWRRSTTGCPTPTPRARRRSRPCSRGCCSTSRSTRSSAARCWSRAPSGYLPGRMLMGFGLLSAILAAFFLWRQKDIKRLFAYSSIEHMGIVTFAFGMGGPVANFAALLHMTVHSLTKSAIFFAAGHASQTAGTQRMDGIRGLLVLSPTIGWGLMLGTLAILGHPALRRLRQRVPDPHHRDARSPLGDADPPRGAGRGLRGDLRPGAADGLRGDEGRPLPHSPALLPVFVHLAMVLTWASTCRRRWPSGIGSRHD